MFCQRICCVKIKYELCYLWHHRVILFLFYCQRSPYHSQKLCKLIMPFLSRSSVGRIPSQTELSIIFCWFLLSWWLLCSMPRACCGSCWSSKLTSMACRLPASKRNARNSSCSTDFLKSNTSLLSRQLMLRILLSNSSFTFWKSEMKKEEEWLQKHQFLKQKIHR